MEAIGANARFFQTDMADAESVNSLVRQCGEVDIIVNITAMAAFKGIPGASGCSASKAALESLRCT